MSTLDARLDELAALSDGWLDGEGIALTPHAIATARAVLGRLASEHPDAPRPRVFPTPDGEVSAEWVLGRVSADVRFPAAGLALDADALHVDTGAEIALTIDGSAPDAPAQIAAWLRAAADLNSVRALMEEGRRLSAAMAPAFRALRTPSPGMLQTRVR